MISNIEYFVKCLQHIFLRTPAIVHWVGNLSNFDIRRCLDLSRDIISSPHLSFEELFAARFKGADEDLPIKEYKVKNALIKKTYTSYPPGHHSFVQNLIFTVDNMNTSPILALRILQLLSDQKNQRNREDDFLSIGTIIEYFANMGVEGMTTSSHLDFLLKKGLIFSYDPTVLEISQSKKVELSPSGYQHHLWALYDDDYLFTMIEASPIPDNSLFEYIEGYYYNWNSKLDILVNFLEFLVKEDAQFCFIPDHPTYSSQKQIPNRLNWRRQKLERIIQRQMGN